MGGGGGRDTSKQSQKKFSKLVLKLILVGSLMTMLNYLLWSVVSHRRERGGGLVIRYNIDGRYQDICDVRTFLG